VGVSAHRGGNAVRLAGVVPDSVDVDKIRDMKYKTEIGVLGLIPRLKKSRKKLGDSLSFSGEHHSAGPRQLLSQELRS
jgi:hypothetical protein